MIERLLRPAALLVLCVAAVAAAGPEGTHTGVARTKRIEVRFRPGSRAAADADRQAVEAERDLDRIAKALDTAPKGPFVVWLYDDVWELAEVTGTRGNAGFSSGNASHVPFDDDQVRTHELVHVVAHEWPESGLEKRNLFVVEGLANAVLEYVRGVHVHAVAAHHRRTKTLPLLAEMLGAEDFYAWCREHPGLDAYGVAASWIRHLLDTQGVAKTKRFYTGTPAKTAFGTDVPSLEAKWHAMLDAYPLRPETETLLRRRSGESVEFAPLAEGVPAAVLATPDAWTPLLGGPVRPAEPSRWKATETGLSVTNPADEWTVCELGEATYADCVVHVRVRTTGYTPVQVRFGPSNQVMLVQPGTFLFRGEEAVASDPTVSHPVGPTRREVFVARRGKRIEVWIDGRKALTTDAGTEGPFRVGVGTHKGSAVFEDVRTRPL